MKRRSFIQKTGVMTGAGIALAGAPAVAQSGGTVKWRLASSFPKSLDTIYGAAEVFAQKVNDMSGGKFQISVHAGGELLPPFEVVDGVRQETIEMAHTAAYYFFGKDPTFAMDCAIPFGLNSRQLTAWMYQGNGLKLFREFYKDYNIVNFPMGNTGTQMGGWLRKEIKSVNDLKGLKFRLGGFAGVVASKLGVIPQNIPGGEIYQSLEKGTIDAAEWIGPYDDEKLGFGRVAKYYYYPGWWEGSTQISLFVNTKAYEGLSAENKAIIESAAAYAHTDMQAKYDARNLAALARLVKSGVELRSYPKPVLTAAFNAAQDIYADLNNKNPKWKKIYADYSKFRKESFLWFKYAEGLYDDFMRNAKL